MIRSMTGFGEAERETAAGTLRAEIRSVNHRHFNANFRTPQALARWEPQMREWLRGHLSRGAVNCSIRLEASEDADAVGLRLDEERVRAYMRLFGELRERFGVPGELDMATFVRLPDVITREEPDDDGPVVEPDEVRALLEEAARRTAEMREEEGRRLHDDLEGRLREIEAALDAVEAKAPERLVAEHGRLRDAVRELAGDVGVDEQRLAQEVAHLAERWDVNEELVRFRSHIELFRQLLDGDASEPVGKRLAFLVQEMHREANTIGSKANDAEISHRVVAIKDQIERLREQVENVE